MQKLRVNSWDIEKGRGLWGKVGGVQGERSQGALDAYGWIQLKGLKAQRLNTAWRPEARFYGAARGVLEVTKKAHIRRGMI